MLRKRENARGEIADRFRRKMKRADEKYLVNRKNARMLQNVVYNSLNQYLT